jgi:hypothetical protein
MIGRRSSKGGPRKARLSRLLWPNSAAYLKETPSKLPIPTWRETACAAGFCLERPDIRRRPASAR